MPGKVKNWKWDSEGSPVGRSNMNQLLGTREYEVAFPYGSIIDLLTANAFAESLYSQVDEEGRSYLILPEIIDYCKDGNAISGDDAKIPGTNSLQPTTKGWQLLVEWKDRSFDWIPLADLKNSYPVQVTEYAANNKIALELAWWVPCNQIIQKVKTHLRKKTHKFGIEVPLSVQEALDIDKRTGTDMWRKGGG
jgi:hypothetical protein